MHKYRPVVFLAGGEDGVCGGRGFEARPAATTPFSFAIFETTKGRTFRFYAKNLGEIRDKIQDLVNA